MTGLAAYAYLGNFTRLIADDFCSMALADRLGLFRSVWYWYLNWSGRYTAFAADWLILSFSLGPYRFHYVVPAVLLLWFIFTVLVLFLYFRRNNRLAFLHSLALAGIFLFGVLLLTPDIPQSLYWWNGMRSYALPLLVLTFYLFLYRLKFERLKVNPWMSCSLGFFLFFLSGGISETMAVAQTAFLLYIISLHLLKTVAGPKTKLMTLYYSLAGAAASLVVVILSPGNAIRQELLPPPPDAATLASISLQSYVVFIRTLWLEPVRAIGILAALIAALWTGGQYGNTASFRKELIPAYFLGGILVSFACFPPGVFGYSEPPPPRVMIIPIFFLLTGLMGAGFMAGSWLAERTGPPWTASPILLVLAVVLIAYSTTATARGLYQQRQIYTGFAERWDLADTRILQAKSAGQDSVTIPALNVWTGGGGDPIANPRYWVNQCYSLYYGLTVLGP